MKFDLTLDLDYTEEDTNLYAAKKETLLEMHDRLSSSPNDEDKLIAINPEAIPKAVKGDFTETLNSDQLNAFELITDINPTSYECQVFLLEGAGGTGKTYTLAKILQYLDALDYSIMAIAPTHKAKGVMKFMLERSNLHSVEVSTVSAALRLKPGRVGKDGLKATVANEHSSHRQIHEFDVVWIDECSMIKEFELTSILARPSKKVLIFTGDRYQLPPVKDGSRDISAVFEKVTNLVTLTKVERYAGYLAVYANHLRQSIDLKSANIPEVSTVFDSADKSTGLVRYTDKDSWTEVMINCFKRFWSEDLITANSSVKAIAYTNKRVAELNSIIRYSIKGSNAPEYMVGDPLVCKTMIQLMPTFDSKLDTQTELTVLEASIKTSHVFGLNLVHWVLRCANESDFTEVELTPIHDNSRKDLIDYLEQQRFEILKQSNPNWYTWEKVLHRFCLDDNQTTNKKNDSVQGVTYTNRLSFSYAITAHQSQGSTYKNCFVDIGNINTILKVGSDSIENKRAARNRCAYVAFTRASKRVFVLY
jgi:hypothetical protein